MELAFTICVVAIARAVETIWLKSLELKKIEATEKKWFDE